LAEEMITISNSTDALLYRLLSQMCFQNALMEQFLQNQQQNNIAPPIPQSPPNQSSNNSIDYNVDTFVNNMNQAVSSPYQGQPSGYMATSNYPIPVYSVNPTLAVQPNTQLLPTDVIKVKATGTMVVSICLDTGSSSLPSCPLITRDNGNTWSALNLGTNMQLGVEYQFSFMMFPGDVFNISFSQVTTIRYMRIAYILSI